jgi:hypothetical protein
MAMAGLEALWVAHGELAGEGKERGNEKRDRGRSGGAWLGAPCGWLLGAAGCPPACSLLFVLCWWLAVREGEEEREEERRGKRKRKKRKEKKNMIFFSNLKFWKNKRQFMKLVKKKFV